MDEAQLKPDETQLTPPPVVEEVSPLLPFIEDVLATVGVVEFQNSYRITPKGLFVEGGSRQKIIDLYKAWLVKKGLAELSDEKIFKKLFASDKPTRYYLAEGKRCLSGNFLECSIKEPMKYRRAYYLGSPSSASDVLHPADPLFQSDLNVRSISGKTGLELEVELGDSDCVISLEAVKDFVKMSAGSKKVQEKFPEISSSLGDGAATLIKILKRSKFVPLNEEPIRPLRLVKDGPKVKCRTRMGFYFYFNETNRLIAFYHSFGLNFFSFVRDEVAFTLGREVRGKIGSFEIFKRANKYMASLIIRGKKRMILAKAFAHYLREAIEAPNLIKEVKGVHSVKTFVEPFINALQLAEPISPAKVSSFLSPKYQRGHDVSAIDMWLFVTNRRGVVVDAISRRATNRRRDQSKKKD